MKAHATKSSPQGFYLFSKIDRPQGRCFFIHQLIIPLHTNPVMYFVCLQEVETEQYYTLFLETLKERGYDGYFCPKSRAKLVSEQERKHVDGCAVFFKTEK